VAKSRSKTVCSPAKYAQLEHGPKAGAWAPAFFTDHEHGREHECAHIGTRLVQNARNHLSHELVKKAATISSVVLEQLTFQCTDIKTILQQMFFVY
jgi:hypothetical protein